ncbi:MAG: hypothetical protein WA446_16315, partial [Steroidobacteraceae bacterium]
MIDKNRVVGDLLFATQIERNVYIGTSLLDQPRWLREHRGRWWYIKDLQREAAPPGPPLESEIDLGPVPAGPNAQTSSRADGDDEDDAGLVEIPAGDRSPPHEPTSLPTPLTTTVENGTTKTELLPPAKPAASEAEGPKTGTTPLGAMGSQRSRSGGRQLKKQKLPAEISELGRKRSPERMRIFLDSLAEDAVLIHATNKACIHRRTPEYWLKCSAAGHDGYDVEWRGVTMKFHEHYISAMEEG